MADELVRLLAAAGIAGPIVVVGHSYGGMVATLVAHGRPDLVVGLVLVDAASRPEVEGEWLANDVERVDGTTVVDRAGSGAELAKVDGFGRMPLVVLTQGRMSEQFQVEWTRLQDELATLLSNAIHVVARDSGHMIQVEAPNLVIAAVRAVVGAVRDGTPLPACGAVLESAGGVCRTP
jgi:pimeloyl-ACP methyl ester carboxylesterase